MSQPSQSEPPTNAVIVGQDDDGGVYLLAGTDKSDDEAETAITEPAKVMRIGRMISRLLDEVKDAPLDDASRARLRTIYEQSINELSGGLDQDLATELHRITSPFDADSTPSDAELRIAQAQLVGWLEGLFQGLQTALVAQHINAQLRQGNPPALPDKTAALAPDPAKPAGGLYL